MDGIDVTFNFCLLFRNVDETIADIMPDTPFNFCLLFQGMGESAKHSSFQHFQFLSIVSLGYKWFNIAWWCYPFNFCLLFRYVKELSLSVSREVTFNFCLLFRKH